MKFVTPRPLVSVSIYEIKNFKVKQMKINETEWPDTKQEANSSNLVPAPPHGGAGQTGTALLLSWDPPLVPMEHILAYIIEYQLEKTPMVGTTYQFLVYACVP